jgi:hypothetical protein
MISPPGRGSQLPQRLHRSSGVSFSRNACMRSMVRKDYEPRTRESSRSFVRINKQPWEYLFQQSMATTRERDLSIRTPRFLSLPWSLPHCYPLAPSTHPQYVSVCSINLLLRTLRQFSHCTRDDQSSSSETSPSGTVKFSSQPPPEPLPRKKTTKRKATGMPLPAPVAEQRDPNTKQTKEGEHVADSKEVDGSSTEESGGR